MRELIYAPHVVAACTSPGGIPKRPHPRTEVFFSGLKGDGHNHAKHNTPLQAVSLQDVEMLEDLCREGFDLSCGSTGENLAVRNMHVNRLPVGTILEFEGGVVLELTKVRKPCYVLDAIDPRLKQVIEGRCGFYAQVLREGVITAGEYIQVKETVRM